VYGPEGINQVLNGFTEAYSLDWKYRNDHHGDQFAPLKAAGFDGYEITDFSKPVYESNGIVITAFLVDHKPIDPSLAFKIEYKGRSIVLSGDTVYSEAILNNSKDVDVLFHEAFHKGTLDMMYNALPENSSSRIGIVDIQNYHTNTIEVANLAKEANVGHLVYYHLIPAPRTDLVADIFTRGIDDILTNWTLSDDGTMVILPADSKEIIITSIN
jgi:ribonuclease Z